jgi:hypothetical protein
MQTMLTRTCHRIGIFVVDTLPVSTEVALLALNIYGQSLSRLRAHVEVIDRYQYSEWIESLGAGIGYGKYYSDILIRNTKDL